MTITETEPEAPTAEAPAGEPGPGVGLASFVGTGDHKRIGRIFLAGSLVGLVATLVAGLLLDIERISATSIEVLDRDLVMQVVSFHRFGALFLFALPALMGLALVVVPLQVGASTVAFGRAAALALWGWLLGSVLWIAGYLSGGGPGGTDLEGTDLWILASILVLASLLLGTVCVLTTVLGLRTRGMTLSRVPFFSFSMLVAGTIWILTLPVAVANLLLVYVDHRYGQVLFGANEAIVAQLAWLATQPQVYAIAIPVLGIALDQVPVFAGARQRYPARAQLAIGALGALAIGAWAQPFMSPEVVEEPLYIAFGIAVLLPVLLGLALALDTVRRGQLRSSASLLLALGGVMLLLVAAGVGVPHVVEPLDLYGTTWTVGHFGLTLLAVVAAVLGAIWYWSTKLFGRVLAEGPARLLGLVLVVGSLLATVPLLVAGAMNQPDAMPPGSVRSGVEALNGVAAAGSAAVLVSVLGLVSMVLLGLRRRGDAPADPWGGHTLEWATASPPPLGNFPEQPEVSSDRPLFAEPAEEASA